MGGITKRFLIYFLAIAIFPIFILGAIGYYFYINIYSASLQNDMIDTVQQMGINVEQKLDGIELYMNLIFQDETIQDLLIKYDFSSNSDLVKRKNTLDKTFEHYFGGDGALLTAAVFDISGGEYVYKDRVSRNISDLRYAQWYKQVTESNGQIIWIGPEKIFDNTSRLYDCFTAARLMKDIKDQNPLLPIGIAYLSFSEDIFSDIYSNDSDDVVMIIDEHGKIVSHTNKDLIGAYVSDSEFYRSILKSTAAKGYFKLAPGSHVSRINNMLNANLSSGERISGGLDSYIYSKIAGYGWTVVKIVNNQTIADRTKTILLITVAICMAFIGCIALVSILMSTSIAKPLLKLNDSMALVEQGDFSVRLVPSRQDEIGKIQTRFNVMTERLSDLFQKTIRVEREKNREHLRALQYQINPHFLYNTLNSVRLMAILSGNNRIRGIIEALIRLLKNTVGKNGEMATVAQEINNVKDYVYLQQIKYDEALQIYYEIDPEIQTLLVPNFILQPLVENAIFHGLEPKKSSEGTLRIRGRAAEGYIEISITDNGIGMTEDQIARVFEEDGNDQGFVRIGIKNINDRIRLNFGDAYGLSISSRIGEGTTITVQLPAIARKEEPANEDDPG